MMNQPDHHVLESALGAGALLQRPNLFSNAQVDISITDYQRLAAFVSAVTNLVATPNYQGLVAQRLGERIAPMPPGVCLAFDFHVGAQAGDAPQLIEINTNAGGALLVTLLERAWGNHGLADAGDHAFLQMFHDEWTAWQVDRPLQTMAIVDESPEQQYLYPEFVLWQKLFESVDIRCLICGPQALRCDGQGQLWHGAQSIDLLYNRLTDFSLISDPCKTIFAAWLKQLAGQSAGTLITPHPQAHALWADKRNLQWLSDVAALHHLGLSSDAATAITQCVPQTLPVTTAGAEYFWKTRKQWFFKPQCGFGSRAAYRGDKVTKRVFEEVLQGGYVAQRLAPPPETPVIDPLTGESTSLKYDLRVYVYKGQIQLMAARLYQGQTTNFRTPGGGFAPVRISMGN